MDGHDPFASAFGGPAAQQADPFASWDHRSPTRPPPPVAAGDPFRNDTFAAPVEDKANLAGPGGPPQRPASPAPPASKKAPSPRP